MPKRHTVRTTSIIIVVTLLSAAAVYFFLNYYFPRTQQSPPQPAAPQLSAAAQQLACIRDLPLKTKLAQKIMVATYNDTIADDTKVAAGANLGGVIVMDAVSGKNIAAFKAAQAITPFVAVDQEGGPVQRYPANGPLPGANEMTDYSLNQAYEMYLQDYKYLASLGFTTNFAPVVDVAYPDRDPLPGRIYSDDPETVTDYAAQAIDAAKAAGVTPVIKHFPGLGSATGNTDFGPANTVNFADLKAKDLVPYQKLSGKSPDVMVNNAIIPGLSKGQPASLSRSVITNTLRGRYGYKDAVVYTDSLTANAILYSLADASVRAWKAGADIALIVQLSSVDASQLTTLINKVIDAGVKAAKSGDLTNDELDTSVQRIFTRKHIDACKI